MAKPGEGKTRNKSKAGRKRSVLVVVIVAVAIGAGAGVWFLLRPSPQRAVLALVIAAPSGSPERLRPLCSAASAQYVAVAIQMISRMPVVIAAQRQRPDISLGKATIQGAMATVPVTLTVDGSKGSSPQSGTINFVCVKENGKWVVDLPGTLRATFGGATGMGAG